MTEKEKLRRKIRIKWRLEAKGLSGAILARRLGMTRMNVNQVIAGLYRSRRVEELLVEVGIPARLVWPELGKERSGEGEKRGTGAKEHRRDAYATEKMRRAENDA